MFVIYSFIPRPQYTIERHTSLNRHVHGGHHHDHHQQRQQSHHSQRVMVRTCNGLELRDPSVYIEASASDLLDSSVLFPSLESRDDLNPRFILFLL